LWDVETGTAIGSALEAHSSNVDLVVFSPDATKLVLVLPNKKVSLWDVETGNLLRIFRADEIHSVWQDDTNQNSSVLSQIGGQLKLKIDGSGFLHYCEGKRLLWLPAHLRGPEIVVGPDGSICIGGSIGAVTLVKRSGRRVQNTVL